MLNSEQATTLIDFARASICARLGAPPPTPPSGAWTQTPAAVFVTIYTDGELRGCIGSVVPHRALVDDVAKNAEAAALRDPRAGNMTLEEATHLGIELSILSPLEPLHVTSEVDALAKINVGDGLVIRSGNRQGLFLPQVWDAVPEPREFLRELRGKAGMDEDAWPAGTEILRFTVEKWV